MVNGERKTEPLNFIDLDSSLCAGRCPQWTTGYDDRPSPFAPLEPILTRILLTWTVLFAVAVLSSADTVVDMGPPTVPGHLILVVEGDANGLSVTHITSKKEPYAPPRHVDGDWTVSVRRADGLELGRFPIDLSRFDLNPARVGQGLRVDGDVVWDTRVATLVSIPQLEDAADLVFHRRGQRLSTLQSEDYARMVQADLDR